MFPNTLYPNPDQRVPEARSPTPTIPPLEVKVIPATPTLADEPNPVYAPGPVTHYRYAEYTPPPNRDDPTFWMSRDEVARICGISVHQVSQIAYKHRWLRRQLRAPDGIVDTHYLKAHVMMDRQRLQTNPNGK